MDSLADGQYDVIVIDVETFDEETVRIELALTRGDKRGEVVSIRGPRTARDPLDLLGLPGVLNVHGGQPSFVVDPGS